MTQKQLRDLNTIVETYGSDKQEDMAIEECSELIKAILKFRRSNAKDSDLRDAVIDEIADVQIMLTQLGIIFNCVEDYIDIPFLAFQVIQCRHAEIYQNRITFHNRSHCLPLSVYPGVVCNVSLPQSFLVAKPAQLVRCFGDF